MNDQISKLVKIPCLLYQVQEPYTVIGGPLKSDIEIQLLLLTRQKESVIDAVTVNIRVLTTQQNSVPSSVQNLMGVVLNLFKLRMYQNGTDIHQNSTNICQKQY